jgi:N-acetylglucosamine-6-sulfatase
MSTRTRPVLPILATLLIVVGVVVIVRVNAERNKPGARAEVARSTRTGRPNVLMIMTDDQTLEEMRVLDNVDRLIVDQGTSFSNYFVAFPNCCPSRTTYMTGQYNHNNGVRENVAPAGGYHKMDHSETLEVWLQRAGYYTASVGKYLNQYGADGNIAPPPGWTRWYGLIDPTTYRYYDYNVSEDGHQQHHGSAPEDYQTDVLGAEVVRIIEDRATAQDPWFLSWTPLAPHTTEGEGASGQGTGDTNDNADDNKGRSVVDRIRASLPVPAPEFEGRMAKESLPKPPSFNQKDVSKLPEVIRKKLPLSLNLLNVMREGYQHELEALLSVDKWVQRIFDMLTRTNQLANTVVVFTSDNGYFHGEHRLSFSKVHLYEAAVHLPLVIRGPGFRPGSQVTAMAGNVDLAPTILAVAGASSPRTLDGRDLAAALKDPARSEERGMLLENWTDNGNTHVDGIRTSRYKYLVTDKHEEQLYDLQADPDELVNRADDPADAKLKADLARRLDVLRSCAGATCEGADAGRH